MGRPLDGGDTTPLDPDRDTVPPPGDVLLVAGEGQLWTFELGTRDLVIGRGSECDVVVEHKMLSRRHAILRPGPPATIQDLGSTNGTKLRGELCSGGDPRELAAGDGFHIGPFTFILVAKAARSDRSQSARELLRISDPTPSAVPVFVHEIAKSDVNVLILGETGVGKEVLASTIHESSRREGQVTRINCAALNESLLESELFGHEKGAFTGATAPKKGLLEAADGGTVFLDEVGELPLSIQAKLLRAVEHREVLRIGSTRPIPIDVRFLAATNRDLPTEVAAGRFRRDLYFRLDGVTFVIPPLRERRGLIAPLALQFLAEAKRRTTKEVRLGPDVLIALEQYPWPGNVRELKAVIERAVLLVQHGELAVRHLAFTRGEAPPPP
ncbi:MAG TPA: sigma 54-interacting transcriptional regulator, partial [Kofleriaceae bacterium]